MPDFSLWHLILLSCFPLDGCHKRRQNTFKPVLPVPYLMRIGKGPVMERAGVIGGIGPESTLDYYRSIIRGFRDLTGSDDYPEIIINSINMTEMLGNLEEDDYHSLVEQLSSCFSHRV